MPSKPTAVPDKLGDPAEWVDRYGDALLRFAGARVANHELAEDLVQETFLLAFRHRSQFDGKSAFGTWLVAILRRRIADHHRKLARNSVNSAEPSAAIADSFTENGKWSTSSTKWRLTPSQLAENSEFWTIFDHCMGSLPLHLAQVFRIRELGPASIAETSRLVGITPENVAVRLHRARLLLRQCLDNKWFRSEREGAS